MVLDRALAVIAAVVLVPGCGLLIGAGDAPAAGPDRTDAGASPDGGAPLDGGGPDGSSTFACGTVGAIQEHFASAESPIGRPYATYDIATTMAGQLEISLTTPSGRGYGGFVAGFRTALRDDAMSVRVIEVPVGTELNSDTYFGVFRGATHGAAFSLMGSMLGMYVEDGASDPARVIVPYNPTLHAYWRIREEGGTLHFETSRDGTAWDPPIRSAPTPSFADDVRIELGAGIQGPGASGRAIFDDLNGGRTRVPMCPPSGFRASEVEFQIESAPFVVQGDPACVIRVGSAARMTTGTAGTSCFVATASAFDFRSAEAITLDLDVPFPNAGHAIVWRISDMNEDYLEVRYHQGSFILSSGGSTPSATGSPGTRWRLRFDGALVAFEVASAGGPFDHVLSTAWVPPAIAHVRFGIESFVEETTPPSYVDFLAHNLP